MLPAIIWLAMSWTALSPEEQKRLTEDAAVVLGKPAARAAARILYAAFESLTFAHVRYDMLITRSRGVRFQDRYLRPSAGPDETSPGQSGGPSTG
jgi:hypothetical protein